MDFRGPGPMDFRGPRPLDFRGPRPMDYRGPRPMDHGVPVDHGASTKHNQVSLVEKTVSSDNTISISNRSDSNEVGVQKKSLREANQAQEKVRPSCRVAPNVMMDRKGVKVQVGRVGKKPATGTQQEQAQRRQSYP